MAMSEYTKETVYSAKNIKVLNTVQAMRLRPAMYTGSHGDKGFINTLSNMLTSIVQNYQVKEIELSFEKESAGKIKFIGLIGDLSKIDVNPLNKLYTIDKKFFDFEILNALSKTFHLKLSDKENNKFIEQFFEKGILKENKITQEVFFESTLEIDFTLDLSVAWFELVWHIDKYLACIKELAFLNHQTKFKVFYKTGEEDYKVVYHYPNGLKDKLGIEKIRELGGTYFNTHIQTTIEDYYFECMFAFTNFNVDETFLISYVNDKRTWENGDHMEALLKALIFGMRKYFRKHNLNEKCKISKKGIKKSLVVFVHIRMENPIYVGSVKNKLANPEIIKPISDYITELFFQKIEANKEATQKLIRRFSIN